MGRKKDLKELRQRGPRRPRVGKQGDPELPAKLRKEDEDGAQKEQSSKKVGGGHVRQRARKRARKAILLSAMKKSKREKVRPVETKPAAIKKRNTETIDSDGRCG